MILTSFPSLIIRHEKKMRNNSQETGNFRSVQKNRRPGSGVIFLLPKLRRLPNYLFLLFVLLDLFFCQGKYLSLTSHFITCQVLVIGGDLIDQLSVYDLYDAVSRCFNDLMVTG